MSDALQDLLNFEGRSRLYHHAANLARLALLFSCCTITEDLSCTIGLTSLLDLVAFVRYILWVSVAFRELHDGVCSFLLSSELDGMV
jgi:hypothetical protein